jgi:hypothetical protein
MNQRHTGFTGYTSSMETNPDPSSTTNSPYLSRRNFGLVKRGLATYEAEYALNETHQYYFYRFTVRPK